MITKLLLSLCAILVFIVFPCVAFIVLNETGEREGKRKLNWS